MGLHPAVRGLEHLYASGTSLRFRLTSHCVHLSLSLLHLPNIISPPVCVYILPKNIFHSLLKRRGRNINQEGTLSSSACLSSLLRCKDFFCFEPLLVFLLTLLLLYVNTKGKATYNGFWYSGTSFPEMAKNVNFLIFLFLFFVSCLPGTSETISTESLGNLTSLHNSARRYLMC